MRELLKLAEKDEGDDEIRIQASKLPS